MSFDFKFHPSSGVHIKGSPATNGNATAIIISLPNDRASDAMKPMAESSASASISRAIHSKPSATAVAAAAPIDGFKDVGQLPQISQQNEVKSKDGGLAVPEQRASVSGDAKGKGPEGRPQATKDLEDSPPGPSPAQQPILGQVQNPSKPDVVPRKGKEACDPQNTDLSVARNLGHAESSRLRKPGSKGPKPSIQPPFVQTAWPMDENLDEYRGQALAGSQPPSIKQPLKNHNMPPNRKRPPTEKEIDEEEASLDAMLAKQDPNASRDGQQATPVCTKADEFAAFFKIEVTVPRLLKPSRVCLLPETWLAMIKEDMDVDAILKNLAEAYSHNRSEVALSQNDFKVLSARFPRYQAFPARRDAPSLHRLSRDSTQLMENIRVKHHNVKAVLNLLKRSDGRVILVIHVCTEDLILRPRWDYVSESQLPIKWSWHYDAPRPSRKDYVREAERPGSRTPTELARLGDATRTVLQGLRKTPYCESSSSGVSPIRMPCSFPGVSGQAEMEFNWWKL